MANRTGMALGVNIGFEDSFGAGAATPAGHTVPRSALRFGAAEQFGETPEIQSNPNPAQPIDGPYSAEGEMGIVATADFMPLIFKMFTGNITTSGTEAPYTHVSKISSNAMLSIWLEKWFSDLSKGDLYKGIRLAGLRLSYRKGAAPLIVTARLMGSGDYTHNGGAQYDATPTAYTDRRHSLVTAVLKVAGTATALIKSFDLDISYEYARQDILDGATKALAIDPGACKITCSGEALWDDADTIRGYGSTEKSVEIITYRPAAATRYVSVKLEETLFKVTQAPDESARGPVTLPFTCVPYYADAAAATALTLTCLNDKAAGVYI